jgi:hypothetical protein
MSGKSANDKRSYSKEEKEERLRIVGIGRGAPLAIDLATENGIGIQDAVPGLGRRQCETGLDRLLLEDTDRVGPVPVRTIEMTIAAGHSHLHFVFNVSCRAYTRTQSLNTAYFPIYFINTSGRQKLLVTGLLVKRKTMAFKDLCARSAECCIKSSDEGLGCTPSIYGFQEYQSKKCGGLRSVPPVAVHEDRREE